MRSFKPSRVACFAQILVDPHKASGQGHDGSRAKGAPCAFSQDSFAHLSTSWWLHEPGCNPGHPANRVQEPRLRAPHSPLRQWRTSPCPATRSPASSCHFTEPGSVPTDLNPIQTTHGSPKGVSPKEETPQAEP